MAEYSKYLQVTVIKKTISSKKISKNILATEIKKELIKFYKTAPAIREIPENVLLTSGKVNQFLSWAHENFPEAKANYLNEILSLKGKLLDQENKDSPGTLNLNNIGTVDKHFLLQLLKFPDKAFQQINNNIGTVTIPISTLSSNKKIYAVKKYKSLEEILNAKLLKSGNGELSIQYSMNNSVLQALHNEVKKNLVTIGRNALSKVAEAPFSQIKTVFKEKNLVLLQTGGLPKRSSTVSLKQTSETVNNTSKLVFDMQLTEAVQRSIQRKSPRGPVGGKALSNSILTIRTGRYLRSIQVMSAYKQNKIRYWYNPIYFTHENTNRDPRKAIEESIRNVIRRQVSGNFSIRKL